MELKNSQRLIERNLQIWRDKILKDFKSGYITPRELSILFKEQELNTAFYKIMDRDLNGEISLQEWTGCFFKLSGETDPSLIQWFVDHLEQYCSQNSKIDVNEQDFPFILNTEFGMRFFELISPKSTPMNTELFISALEKISRYSTVEKLHSGNKFKYFSTIQVERCESAQNSQNNWFQRTKETLMNNRGLVIFWLVYTIIHIFVTIDSYHSNREKSGWQICARIFGNGLNFNFMLILLLVLKKHFTWLQANNAETILSRDDYNDLQKKVGIIILIETLIHTIAYLIYFYDRCKATGENYWTFLFTNKLTKGFPTGVLGLILLILILIFTVMIVRERGYFQSFNLFCPLFVVWLLVMVFHGKDFWKWLLAPASYFTIEYLQRHREVSYLHLFGNTVTTEAV